MSKIVFSLELLSGTLSDQPYTLRAIADDEFYQMSDHYGEFTVSKKGTIGTVEFNFSKPLPGVKYAIQVLRSDNNVSVLPHLIQRPQCDFNFDPTCDYKFVCTVTPAVEVSKCTAWKNFIACFKEDPDLTMTFQVGGDEIEAVTTLMMDSSPVIKAMMQSDCIEAKTKIVKIEDFALNVVVKFIQFCENNGDYCENVDYLDLYRIADKYDVEPLRRCALELIIKSIDEQNVIQLCEFARTYQCLELKKRCIEFADAYSTEVHETADISDVIPPAVEVSKFTVRKNFIAWCKEDPALMMTFKVGDDEIKTVTRLMMSRSPVIKAMMQSDCIEAKTRTVKIEDFSIDVVRGFVLFCETNGVRCDVPFFGILISDLFKIADKYDVEPMRKALSDWTIGRINNKNVIKWFEFARTCQCLELEKGCIEFAVAHFMEVHRSAIVSIVSAEAVKDFWTVSSEYRSITYKESLGPFNLLLVGYEQANEIGHSAS